MAFLRTTFNIAPRLFAEFYRLRIECFGKILKNRSPEKYPTLNFLKKKLRRKP